MALIVVFVNKSKLAPVSDYGVQVLVNDTTLYAGEVKGHKRCDGWQELLKQFVAQLEEK